MLLIVNDNKEQADETKKLAEKNHAAAVYAMNAFKKSQDNLIQSQDNLTIIMQQMNEKIGTGGPPPAPSPARKVRRTKEQKTSLGSSTAIYDQNVSYGDAIEEAGDNTNNSSDAKMDGVAEN